MATSSYDLLAQVPRYDDPAQTYAALTRQAFSDFVTNLMPYQDKLFQFGMDTTQPTLAMARAKEQVTGAFDQQKADLERQLRPLGPLTAEEQKSADRTLALSQSAASAGAQNRARDLTKARQAAVLGNPTMGGIV